MRRVQFDRYGGPEEMYVGEHALPRPRPGEVRVRVAAAAVNPLDWKLRQGALKLLAGRAFPRGMGSDFAGVVEAAGDGVTHLQPGDEVLGTMDFRNPGAFAEVVLARADLVTRKPPKLSFAQAACVPIPAATAWAAIVEKGRAQTGSRVFVNGCSGAVGLFAVQLARDCGATVMGSCSPAAVDGARAAGADRVFDYRNAAAYAAAGKFDVVFDAAGELDVGRGLSLLTPGGVFVDINPTPARLVRGMVSGRYKLVFANMGFGRLGELAALAGEGVLRPRIGVETPFGDAIAALTRAEVGPRPDGRTVLMFPA